jgi:hypothetical protein
VKVRDEPLRRHAATDQRLSTRFNQDRRLVPLLDEGSNTAGVVGTLAGVGQDR